jgi:uncharacterized protein YdeI (YjbR/CyaY-like superfamily)
VTAKRKRSSHAPSRANTRTFTTAAAWAEWLREHHATSDGVWLRFFKKTTGRQTFAHADALDEALCWGWIDGQAQPYDDESWLQRYTPRRPRSGWSKRNRDYVARLERGGRMQPAGRAQVEAAKRDGRWDRAYDSPANAAVPEDFLRALRRHKGALAFFKELNRANVFAIAYRLQTAARPETRQRRFDALVQMIRDRRRLH